MVYPSAPLAINVHERPPPPRSNVEERGQQFPFHQPGTANAFNHKKLKTIKGKKYASLLKAFVLEVATAPPQYRGATALTSATEGMHHFTVPQFIPKTLIELPVEPDEVSSLVYLEDSIAKELVSIREHHKDRLPLGQVPQIEQETLETSEAEDDINESTPASGEQSDQFQDGDGDGTVEDMATDRLENGNERDSLSEEGEGMMIL